MSSQPRQRSACSRQRAAAIPTTTAALPTPTRRDHRGSRHHRAAGGDTTAAAGGGSGEGVTVGLLFDITGRGDKSFNDAAAAGLDKAASDLGITASESTPTGDGDRAERART